MNAIPCTSAHEPSRIAWLGNVPKSWEIARLKGVVANVVDITRTRDRDDIYLALEHVESWTGRFTVANDAVGFDSQGKRFRAGDVLFGKLRPYLAKVVCPRRGGVCAGEFLVLRPRRVGLVPKYLEQLLRSKPVVVAIDASTFGAKMPRADWQFIGNMKLPFFPFAEQLAIVRFLDHADLRIHRYIRAKERLIELLEEQKQATIHQAVTGQIDVRTGKPYPAYKDSGVEWLGEVPEHWEVGRLKHLAHGITVGIVVTPSKYYVDQGVPCLRSLNVSAGAVDMEDLVFISESANEFHRKSKIYGGDVVVGSDRTSWHSCGSSRGTGWSQLYRSPDRAAVGKPVVTFRILLPEFVHCHVPSNDAVGRRDPGSL